MIGYLEREAEIGGYETSAERVDDWEHTYDALARLVNGDRDEIAVVENATRAWDMAFYAFRFEPGRPDPDRARASTPPTGSPSNRSQPARAPSSRSIPDDEHGQLDVARAASAGSTTA